MIEVDRLYSELNVALEGHDRECAFRCLKTDCRDDHWCSKCQGAAAAGLIAGDMPPDVVRSDAATWPEPWCLCLATTSPPSPGALGSATCGCLVTTEPEGFCQWCRSGHHVFVTEVSS